MVFTDGVSSNGEAPIHFIPNDFSSVQLRQLKVGSNFSTGKMVPLLTCLFFFVFKIMEKTNGFVSKINIEFNRIAA
jgi:hypothetical protein